MTSYRNSAEILLEWRRWKDDTWVHCPFAIHDKMVCNARLCPCGKLQANIWINSISGYLGTVKLVKFLASRNGNGRGNGEKPVQDD